MLPFLCSGARYVFMFLCICYIQPGGGVVYTIPLYVKKTYNRVKLGLKNVFLCQNDICLYVFMFLGILQYGTYSSSGLIFLQEVILLKCWHKNK